VEVEESLHPEEVVSEGIICGRRVGLDHDPLNSKVDGRTLRIKLCCAFVDNTSLEDRVVIMRGAGKKKGDGGEKDQQIKTHNKV
jgi:hypothetical protein